LPLRFASNRSIRERARKWVRRHPRFTSMTSVAVMLGIVLAALASALAVRGRQLAGLEAQETLRQFRADARDVQFLLYSRHADRGRLEDGIQRSRAALGRFAILDNAAWHESALVGRLPDAERARLQEEAGEMLFLLARALVLHAQAANGSWDGFENRPTRQELREARRLNGLAEASFGMDRVPRAVWQQRADIAGLLGDADEAKTAAAQAERVPLRTPRDRYLVTHQYAIRGELRRALDLLQTVTVDDPQSFPAWFVRANCHYDLLEDAGAVACYNACITLRPEFHWSWFNRGLAYLRLRQFRRAADDFEQVLRLAPNLADAHVSRALALEGMNDNREAVAEYTQALQCRGASTRIYFLRSAAKNRLGDAAGARRDYHQGLAGEPTDELGWIARGSARRDRDAKGALADYEQALALNPRSFDALQNKAALLSDKFGDDQSALAVLETAVRFYPESVLARGGRGVLLARAGKRAPAIEDAKACLLLDSGPATLYQVGCIYALTSKEAPADRQQALPLLSAALRAGFGLEFVDHDPDLDPLRKLPEFQRLVAAGRALR
jgi:eukaryotic-like serine/threonine-protein kinase